MITLIAAMDGKRVIGFKGSIPWHLKSDLQHFKEATLGKTVIMGRKTFESLKKPLPERVNVVVTTQEYHQDGIVVEHDLESLLKRCQQEDKEYMVIGGASLYQGALKYADKIILSLVPGEHEGDTFFPLFEDDFYLVSIEDKDGFVVKIYKR